MPSWQIKVEAEIAQQCSRFSCATYLNHNETHPHLNSQTLNELTNVIQAIKIFIYNAWNPFSTTAIPSLQNLLQNFAKQCERGGNLRGNPISAQVKARTFLL
jgi:hypothetical protein